MITDQKINRACKDRYYAQGYWSNKTLGEIWGERVARYAQQEYVIDDQGSRLTYAKTDEGARRLAAWLIAQGIAPGDVITFQLPSWVEFCIVYLACLKVGAVMHPVPKNYTEEELIYNMNKVGSRAFICPTHFKGCDYEQQALNLRGRIARLEAIVLVDKFRPSHSELPTLSSLLDKPSSLAKEVAVCSDDVACLLTTSGTTGRPKVAMFTHNNLIFSESVFARELGRTQRDVMFMPSPLNHATGFFHGLIAPMILGAKTVLQQDFNAKDAVALCNKEGVTWSMGATPFIYDILKYFDEHEIAAPETLSLFLCGGAAVPDALVRHAWSKKILLCEIYGSTESCPHIYVPPEKCLEWSGAFSGIPFEGIEVRVVDSERQDVAPGVQGEEISRGPHQFVGYLNDPERTNRQLDDEGWFYSGDLCVIDEENRIRICGRKKEIIIRGGENLCVREIDDNILGCPGVDDHATIGMPDERLGERICTFVVSWDEAPPSLEDIKSYLAKAQVAKRFWPERIEYIDAIPKTMTGKVKRHLLAAELARRLAKEKASS